MDGPKFLKMAIDHGFSPSQAAFLAEHVAQRPHTHTADEVIVDSADGETLDHLIDELVATEVFEDGPVLHAEEEEEFAGDEQES